MLQQLCTKTEILLPDIVYTIVECNKYRQDTFQSRCWLMIKGDKKAKSLILLSVSRKDYIVLHIITNATMSEERKNICVLDNFF